MASFGKLNEANVVLSVLKVDDKQLLDGDGVKQESLGQAFLENITGWPANQWIWDNGLLREQDIERARENILKASSRELEEVKLNEFKNLLSKL